MPLRIREAQLEQAADIICGMDVTCFPDDAITDLAGLRWWIAWDGAVPVGYVGANFKAGTLDRIGVMPSHRGRRIAPRLASACLRALRRAGHAHAESYTSSDNGASINTLVGLGFRFARAWNDRGGTRRLRYAFITWRLAFR